MNRHFLAYFIFQHRRENLFSMQSIKWNLLTNFTKADQFTLHESVRIAGSPFLSATSVETNNHDEERISNSTHQRTLLVNIILSLVVDLLYFLPLQPPDIASPVEWFSICGKYRQSLQQSYCCWWWRIKVKKNKSFE